MYVMLVKSWILFCAPLSFYIIRISNRLSGANNVLQLLTDKNSDLISNLYVHKNAGLSLVKQNNANLL